MFTKVEKTTEKKEILPKYIKEISEEEYNKFINKDFEIANIY